MDYPPDLPDDYDTDEEGPEAKAFRELYEEETRARRRTDDLLRAIERDRNPVEQGRQAAERLHNEVNALLAAWHVGRKWVRAR
jgi:hypothetical protein